MLLSLSLIFLFIFMFTPIIVYIINQDINLIPFYLTLGKEIVLPTIYTIKNFVLLSIEDVLLLIKVGRDFLSEIRTIFVICFFEIFINAFFFIWVILRIFWPRFTIISDIHESTIVSISGVFFIFLWFWIWF